MEFIINIFADRPGLAYILSAFLAGLLFAVLAGFIIKAVRNREAKTGVLAVPPVSKAIITALQTEEIARLMEEAGYAYDRRQNIFYSTIDAWQRKFGYCRLYDETAPAMGMVIDCEPVYFEYDGRRWMIELWKGQYGITTGCEVGVYCAAGPDLNIPGVFNGTLYYGVSGEDQLAMSCYLTKNGKYLFSRRGRHWWLTGFVLGMFSDPAELAMTASITLKDAGMREAFVASLREIGYTDGELAVSGNRVMITFTKPHTKQPSTRRGLISWIAQRRNKHNCKLYAKAAKGFDNMYDILTNVRKKAPKLYDTVLNMGKPEKLFKRHEALMKHAD